MTTNIKLIFILTLYPEINVKDKHNLLYIMLTPNEWFYMEEKTLHFLFNSVDLFTDQMAAWVFYFPFLD